MFFLLFLNLTFAKDNVNTEEIINFELAWLEFTKVKDTKSPCEKDLSLEENYNSCLEELNNIVKSTR
tara:strand:- start:432 stop:632 length:201 start_codon:yes stop_codon:yes gene_type:complete